MIGDGIGDGTNSPSENVRSEKGVGSNRTLGGDGSNSEGNNSEGNVEDRSFSDAHRKVETWWHSGCCSDSY